MNCRSKHKNRAPGGTGRQVISNGSGWVPVDAAKSGDEDEIVCLLTNCDHHCPADIFTEVALIVFIIPFLLLLSLESVVRLAFARVCIL